MAKRIILKKIYLGQKGDNFTESLNDNYNNLNKAISDLDGENVKNKNVTQTLGFSQTNVPSEYAVYKEVNSLQEQLDNKADKGDVSLGLINKGTVAKLSNLPRPSYATKGDAYYVESEGFIYQYDGKDWNPTIFTAFPSNVVIASDIDLPAVQNFIIHQNDEFCYLITDTTGVKLFGIRWDASYYIPRVPDIIESELDKLTIDIASLTKIFKEKNTDGWIELKLDSKGQLLEGIREDGTKYIAKGIPVDVQKIFDTIIPKIISSVQKEDGQSLINEDYSNAITSIPSSEFLEVTTDKEGKILSSRSLDGVKYESQIETDSLKLSNKGMSQFLDDIKRAGLKSGTDYTGYNNLRIPIPAIAGKLNITASRLPSTKTDDLKSVCELYLDNAYIKFNAINNAQGSSSLSYYYPRRNMSLDLFVHDNDNSFNKELKIQFGDWVAQSSFYLKAYYIDAFRGQCVVSYRLCREMYNALPYGNRKPWEYLTLRNVTNSQATGNIKTDYINGASAISDGFAVEIYHNGEYHGIGVISLKKHRDNMNMSKSNVKHIYLDGVLSSNTIWGGVIDWTQFEVRNPKDLKTLDGSKYDGDNPTELTADASIDAKTAKVKGSIERLASAVPNIKANTSKKEFEKYFRPDYMIDYILHAQITMNFDGFSKNWLWCSWDGKLFAPMFHDHDSLFSQFWNGCYADNVNYNPKSTILGLDDNLPSGLCQTLYKAEFEARYKELRDKGILSVKHIIGLLEEWVNHVGYENYKKEFEKYPETPSYRESFVNSEYWEFARTGRIWEEFYDESKTYKVGKVIRYGKAIGSSYCMFRCIKENAGELPLTQLYNYYPYEMGFYNSIERVRVWLQERIAFLDTYYNYKFN